MLVSSRGVGKRRDGRKAVEGIEIPTGKEGDAGCPRGKDWLPGKTGFCWNKRHS